MTVPHNRVSLRTFSTAGQPESPLASDKAVPPRLLAKTNQKSEAHPEPASHQDRPYLDLVPLPLLILDKGGRCLFANQAASQLFNTPSGHLESVFILDLLSLLPDTPGLKTWKILTRSEQFSINAVLRYSLGIPMPVLLEVRQVGNNYFAHCKKTLANRETQEDQEGRLQFIQKMVKLGLWEWHVPAGIIHLSSGMQHVLSLPIDAASFSYDELDRLVYPPDRPGLKEAFPTVPFAEGGSCELRMLSQDGCWNWVSIHGHVVERDKKGVPLRYTGVVANITDRKQHEQENALFFQISHAIHTTRNLDEFFSLLLDLLIAGLSITELEVALFQKETGEANLLFYKTALDGLLPGPPARETPSSRLFAVIRNGESVNCTIEDETGQGKNTPWMGVPLRLDGSIIGGLAVSRSTTVLPFAVREHSLLHTVAEQASMGIERKQHEERLAHLALYDSLTGLPNRVLFMERAQRGKQRAQRHPSTSCALMLLDLDHFKTINDTYGHKAGDDVLRSIAQIVAPLLRSTDTVARLGGDEFAVFLEDVSTTNEALVIARRVLNGLAARITMGTMPINCSASMGIVLDAQHYDSVDHMLEDADAALYRVKERKRGSLRVFTPALRSSLRQRQDMERLLYAALPARQFRLFMQPAFGLHDSRLYCMEALLRWSPAPDTLLSPHHFLSRAESLGLTRQLDQWTLETICELLYRTGPLVENFCTVPISVNISPASAVSQDFPSIALNILENANLPAGCLRIEFPEQALAASPRKARANIIALAEAGFPILLDGFGMSHAPLHLLHDLPLAALKFAPSCLAIQQRDNHTSHFMRTLAFFAAELMIDTVSVGVETQVQRRLAADLGCRAAQGYFFQRPLPLEEVWARSESLRKDSI